nr:hypothetical protein [Pseudoclavibacter helvolus]
MAVEEQFYVVFALLWLGFIQLKNPRRALIALTAVTIAYATIARFLLLDDGDIRIARATDTRLDSIAWGVLAAVLLSYFRGGGAQWLARLGRDWAFYTAGALFLVSFAPLGDAFELTMRYSFQSVATVLLILYGMLIEGKMSATKSVMLRISAWRPIAIVGLASYSIYLAHSVFKALTSPLIEGLLPRPVEILLYTVAGALVGIALWQWVEKPSLKARHRFTKF